MQTLGVTHYGRLAAEEGGWRIGDGPPALSRQRSAFPPPLLPAAAATARPSIRYLERLDGLLKFYHRAAG